MNFEHFVLEKESFGAFLKKGVGYPAPFLRVSEACPDLDGQKVS